jgi:hypothetical protein
MNPFQVFSVSQPGPKEQQDAVSVAVLPKALVFAVVDGMSAFASSTVLAPRWANWLVGKVAEMNPGVAPTTANLLAAELGNVHHEMLRELGGAGLAAVVVLVTDTGVCHFAGSGDVGLWVRESGKSEWAPVNNSKPHDDRGRLAAHLGVATGGERAIFSGTRDSVEEIAAMTDGFYDPAKNVGAGGQSGSFPDERWCPREPPYLNKYRSESVAVALTRSTPQESTDNYSAVYARVERAQLAESRVAPTPETDPRTEKAMWAAVALATVAVVLFFWSTVRSPVVAQQGNPAAMRAPATPLAAPVAGPGRAPAPDPAAAGAAALPAPEAAPQAPSNEAAMAAPDAASNAGTADAGQDGKALEQNPTRATGRAQNEKPALAPTVVHEDDENHKAEPQKIAYPHPETQPGSGARAQTGRARDKRPK